MVAKYRIGGVQMNMRPESTEFPPMAVQYINLVPEGSLTGILQQQLETTRGLLSRLSDDQGSYRYADGKWSVKEVVGHLTDSERTWSYRVFRISRGDTCEITGYDRDAFVTLGRYHEMAMHDIIGTYSSVRQATLSLIKGLTEEDWLRQGAFQEHPLSARAAACIIAGHEIHHLNVIKAKYLSL
jgi:hypothetical protein